jgi:aryl-alcohol dehydrogenase-like predicted oxidoreductase
MIEQLEAWAREHGHTLGELAHAWLLAQPQVSSVISGATNVEQVQTNAQAANWTLTAEKRAQVNALLR